MPTLGGSLPMYAFEQVLKTPLIVQVLKTPLIVLPIVNHDNSQHAANENLRLQNLWDGMVVYAGIMTDLGKRWAAIVP